MLELTPLPPRIIPCLLLQQESFVKTTKFKNPVYIGDPVNTINLFNKFEVDEIVVLDIDCARKKNKPNFYFIEELASECWVPLTYGGGIQSVADAKKILNAGVEKVLIESLIFENPAEAKKCVEEFGASSVVGCISVKKSLFGKYEIFTQGGCTKISLDIENAIEQLKEIGVGEIMINNISRDGSQKGYDIELIKRISKQVDCPVVALGGASCLTDFKSAIEAGASAASAGSYFVFQQNNLSGVLINFPSRLSIEELFNV